MPGTVRDVPNTNSAGLQSSSVLQAVLIPSMTMGNWAIQSVLVDLAMIYPFSW